MGGGGGGTFHYHTPEKLKEKVRAAESKAENTAFETALADSLARLLAKCNDRDTDEIARRLDAIRKAIESDIEGTINTLFGGSVAKHTYVDGLSDVDALVIINNTNLINKNPEAILKYIAKKITAGLRDVNVAVGRIAVTIEYKDGLTIQILPAVKTDSGVKVPSWIGKGWSSIKPEEFRNALIRRNKECGGKLVPTIKLAKAINATFPEPAQLTGYHIESIAIAAFRGYKGPYTVTKMLPYFFDQGKDLVLKRITDSTGQSINVDEYLGEDGSDSRTKVSHLLNRIAKRMKNASAANSQEQWLSLFGDT